MKIYKHLLGMRWNKVILWDNPGKDKLKLAIA